jgi:putative ABC transport system substrate-binding protein
MIVIDIVLDMPEDRTRARMAKRLVVAWLAGALLFLVGLIANAEAQQEGKVYRIGLIGASSTPGPEVLRIYDAFFAGLAALGYVENKNLIVERRYSESRTERYPELAAELVRLRVDLIVVFTTPAALAAKGATSTIPILIPTANDPVGAGLARSLARPGGNVTGLAGQNSELSAKRLELLKEVVPRATRVAVLFNAANPAQVVVFRQTVDAARRLGIVLEPAEVRASEDFKGAFAAIRKNRVDALIVPGDQLTLQHREQIARFALEAKLPTMLDVREMVVAGGLMSYGPSFAEMARRGSAYADRLLRGANPADLPFEQVEKFQLVLNAGAARRLGIVFPTAVLVRADEVME